MRYTKSGTIQDAVAQAYRAAGGVEAVADRLGLANSTVSYGTELNEHRPGGLGVNYLARLGQEDPSCAVPLAEFFAQLAGGRFEPYADGEARSPTEHVTRLVRELSEAVEKLNDPKADPADVRSELQDLVEAAVDALRDVNGPGSLKVVA